MTTKERNISTHWETYHFPTLPSTQDTAKSLYVERTPLPFVVMADHQTAGRGRSGRSWSSLPDNLQCTCVIPSGLAVRYAGQYAFLVAVAFARVLEAYKVAPVQLKWPNDVLVEGRKIAGILLESDVTPEGQLSYILIGTGVNVGSAPEGAVSLWSLSGRMGSERHPSPHDVLQAYIKQLDVLLEQFHREGFQEIRQEWMSRAYGLGASLRVRLPSETFEGIFEGVNEDGALCVRVVGNDAPRIIHAGDVFFGE